MRCKPIKKLAPNRASIVAGDPRSDMSCPAPQRRTMMKAGASLMKKEEGTACEYRRGAEIQPKRV